MTLDEAGRSTVVEDILTGGRLLQRSVVFLAPPASQPGGLLLDLLGQSLPSDDRLLQHILRLSELQRGPMGAPPAPKEAIDALEEVSVVRAEGQEPPACSICCEDLKEKATKLPCGHMFHGACVKQWLEQHNQCPVCRHALPDQQAEATNREEASSDLV